MYPSHPQATGLSQEELDAIAAIDDIRDPYAEVAPPARSASPEIVDPYAEVKARGYGPQTSGMMASPEAPAYVPPAPPPAPASKAAFSATGDQRELLGKTVETRDVDSEIARLGEMRGQMQPFSAPAGPGANERQFRDMFGDQDKKAQRAFVMNWIAGGPEQAMRFQQAYDQRRAAYGQGLTAARDKDVALARGGEPISDAQAQMLVRAYKLRPEAVANMTRQQYAELEALLKSTPYVANQQDARLQNTDLEILKELNKLRSGEAQNAASYGETQLRGENAVRTVKANQKQRGEGGGAGPRDIRSVLVGMYGADAVPTIDRVISGIEQGGVSEQEFSPEEQEIAANYRNLEGMAQKEWIKQPGQAVRAGAVQRTNREFATDETTRGKVMDPARRMQVSDAWRQRWTGYQRAAAAFKLLRDSGKIDLIVKTPYGEWDRVINSRLTGPEQDAARAIAAFINPTMRQQTGAALSGFEKDMSFTQFGIAANASPFASSDRLRGFLQEQRDKIMQTKQTIDESFPGLLEGGQ